MSETLRRLGLARLRLAEHRPYYALAAYRLIPYEAPGLGTAAVDAQWRLALDPDALQRWTVEETAGVLEHELGHLLRDHAGRAARLDVGSEQALAFNLAADAELNDDLERAAVVLPAQSVTPATLGLPNGELVEWYYERILAQDPAPNSSGRATSDCGSGAHGVRRDWEPDPTGVAGVSDLEADLIRRQTAERVLHHSRTRGTVPAGLRRWADGLLTPVVDWRRVLARTVRASMATVAGLQDYTYSRPSRRASVMHPVVAPTLRRPDVRVAAVIDTSGSVSDRMLTRALGEVGGIVAATGCDHIDVVSCDADATVERLRPRRLATATLVGGGGTDMGVGLATAHSLRPRPDIVIVLTDGLTPWPTVVPRSTAHVVALFGAPDTSSDVPSWASVVHIPSDDREPF